LNHHVHVSIGPVQAFVAQSRRTRDLWSSSYLLSFLVAHAMHGARTAGATILRPRVDDDAMLRWIEGQGTGAPPRLGSLPNQFTATTEDPERTASAVGRQFRAAWEQVSHAVWEQFVVHAAPSGNGTDAIWKRQIEGFWELLWIAGAPSEHGLLALRKLWRTHWLPEEPGDKCSLMPDLQELSGHVRATQRAEQDAFWQTIRARLSVLDLEPNERLSAVALVKRLYPRIAASALGWDLDVAHWPSSVDIAAGPWCRRVLSVAAKEGNGYAVALSAVTNHVFTGGFSALVETVPPDAERFARLDANWLHRSFVITPKAAPLADEATRQALVSHLERIGGLEDAEGPLGAPPIYFAILLADGDHLGRLVATKGSDLVSTALAEFTRTAPGVVRAHGGVTVYAGGDDVLALLPIETALECARAVERAYRRAFDGAVSDGSRHGATLSAAVVFAHARAPMRPLLAEAHRLLDTVAKDQNGRASLVAGIYRSDGLAADWVTTWTRTSTDGSVLDSVQCMVDAAKALKAGAVSGSLLQDVRRTLAMLSGASPPRVGAFVKLATGVEPLVFVRADVEHSLSHRDRGSGEIDPSGLAAVLTNLLSRARVGEDASPYVSFDGLLVASFLAGGGVEEEHQP